MQYCWITSKVLVSCDGLTGARHPFALMETSATARSRPSVRRNFTRVNLVSNVAAHHPLCPNRRPKRASFPQVEAPSQTKRHDAGSLRSSNSRNNPQDSGTPALHTGRLTWTLGRWRISQGNAIMNITKRYVYPQEETIRAAMDRAQVPNSGHTSGHAGQKQDLETASILTPTI